MKAGADRFDSGSIRDRIVRAIWALGEIATKAKLRKAVDCANDTIYDMQIEALHKRGDIFINACGAYAVSGEIADTLLELYPPEQPPGSIDSRPPAQPHEFLKRFGPPTAEEPAQLPLEPPPPQEITVNEEKHCPGCDTDKPKDEFDKNQRRCKPCVKDGTGLKASAAAKAKPAAKPAKKKASKSKVNGAKKHAAPADAPTPIADEFVIPAAGEIRCQVIDAGAGATYLLRQGAHEIVAAPDQLQAIRDWATGQLKRTAA